MFDLALHYGHGPIPLKDIARRQELSLDYLEHLFIQLRRAGLIQGVRGPKGGFLLTKPPDRIKVGEIIRVLEGPISLVHCVINQNGCHRAEFCVSRLLWKRVGERIEEVLDSTTLEDLIHEAEKMMKGKGLDYEYALYLEKVVEKKGSNQSS